MNSYGRGSTSNSPAPPRIAIFPFRNGSQAKPTRGSKFFVVGLLAKKGSPRWGLPEVMSQVRKLAVNLGRYSSHFITEAQVQREIRFPTPVILDISAKQSLTKIARRKRAGDS